MRALFVFGTRPEAIKLAPLVLEMRKRPAWEPIVAVTAQHREMLDQVLGLFGIEPDYDLNLMKPGQSLEMILAGVFTHLPPVLTEARPDVVVVQGDTTTTFCGAMCAFTQKVPVAYVEAGLRTNNKYSPFPEEINRRLTSVVADYCFAPTETNRQNLLGEGYDDSQIWVTGNTVIDALLHVADRDFHFDDPQLANLPGRLILVTAHRRESFGEPFRNLCRGLAEIARRNPDDTIVYPVHLNPNVRQPVSEILDGIDNIRLIEPLDYEPFVHLLKKAHLVLTDSGGIQEEAPGLGIPVLVMRDTTERPEGVDAGTVKLVGTATEKIVGEAIRLLDDEAAYAAMAQAKNPYGDGRACPRICELLEGILGT
ncbi:MAG: UDP-N-acetylglucosamine 2-epimerase (non-hydrolyzing) [Candidatus Lernaella stagnicola]|nr:UDP-N-acetylglucosamine 2-epimerase (non-hydrolyzing) [Candidatus Lernaella stagnicola]